MFIFFFFKQKTAYEMRISDWSSDVCSSDLPIFAVNIALARDGEVIAGVTHVPALGETFRAERGAGAFLNDRPIHVSPRATMVEAVLAVGIPFAGKPRHEQFVAEMTRRSEEHTSELQSLMRISYAVFCLKKKKHTSH